MQRNSTRVENTLGDSTAGWRAGGAAKRNRRNGILLAIPAVVVVAAVAAYPMLHALWMSFHEADLPRIDPSGSVTLENYTRLFQDPRFAYSLSISLLMSAAVVGLSTGVGLALATALNQQFRGRAVVRLLVFLPWAIPEVIAGNIWRLVLDAQYGPLNHILESIGLISEPIAWLATELPAITSVVVVSLWKAYPFYAIMLLAGLQAIDPALEEAATIDGANRLQVFRHVVIPGLRPVLVITAILGAMQAVKSFSIIWILTAGGPARATETLSLWTYISAFSRFEMDYAAAIGIFLLVLLLAIGAVTVRKSAS